MGSSGKAVDFSWGSLGPEQESAQGPGPRCPDGCQSETFRPRGAELVTAHS